MNSLKFSTVLTLFALLMFFLQANCCPVVQAKEPVIDPAATEILKSMTDYLAGLEKFSVQTQNTLEDTLGSGHRIDLEVSASVTISRPNRLRSERKGDLVDQVFFYDGKSLTLYNPSSNVYATKAAPGRYKEMFIYLFETLGFAVPISDLVYPDAYDLLMQDVTFAAVVGKSYINGVKCDHLIFSRPGVDFQVWVSEGSRPLPRKYVVTDTLTPGLMSFVTTMNNWDVEPGVEDIRFTFVPPKGAQEIDFLPY